MNSFKFAHFADVHLGAFRDEVLREANLEAFRKACDECMAEGVDFIIIAGDLFHSPIPDLAVVSECARKLRELKDVGIRVYAVYGSHDYSPAETSVIEVLANAGLLKKVFSGDYDGEEKLLLEFIVDEKTGVKLTGLPARKKGLEAQYYKDLDRASLEKEEGFKVFVFHSSIEEFKPVFLKGVEGIPLGNLPKGFDYYAGGHVHDVLQTKEENFGEIVFPGPLFASDYRDLEDLSARKHGFFLVEATDGVIAKIFFKEVNEAVVEKIEFDAGGKNALKASEELLALASHAVGDGKIVLLKVFGELSEGKPSEIDFSKARELLSKARCVYFNKNGLTARGMEIARVGGGTPKEIVEKLFEENAVGYGTQNVLLKNDGARLAKELLTALSQEKKNGEKKGDYEERLVSEGKRILEVD